MNLLSLIGQVDIKPNQVNIPKTDLDPNGLPPILQIVFGIAGVIAFLVIVIAGLRFVLSAGDPQKTAQARNTIIYALVGLVISIMGFSIVTFVLTHI